MTDEADISGEKELGQPAVGEILRLVEHDLSSSRGMLERLLNMEEAFTGAAATITAALLGLAFTKDEAALAWINLPIVFVFWLLSTANRVHFRRVSARVARLERIVQSYVVALREHGVSRPAALRRLRRELDAYSFGTENAILRVKLADLRRGLHSFQRTLLFVGFAVLTTLSGIAVSFRGGDTVQRVCVRAADGAVAELTDLSNVSVGQLQVVLCPKNLATGD